MTRKEAAEIVDLDHDPPIVADVWDEGGNVAFAGTARRFLDAGVPVAAICGATLGLAAEGLLDDRDHTSAAPAYLAMTGYAGADRYCDAPAVTNGDLITAGPTDGLAFAKHALARSTSWSQRCWKRGTQGPPRPPARLGGPRRR